MGQRRTTHAPHLSLWSMTSEMWVKGRTIPFTSASRRAQMRLGIAKFPVKISFLSQAVFGKRIFVTEQVSRTRKFNWYLSFECATQLNWFVSLPEAAQFAGQKRCRWFERSASTQLGPSGDVAFCCTAVSVQQSWIKIMPKETYRFRITSSREQDSVST